MPTQGQCQRYQKAFTARKAVYTVYIIGHVPVYNLQFQVTVRHALQSVTLGKNFKMLVAVRQ